MNGLIANYVERSQVARQINRSERNRSYSEILRLALTRTSKEYGKHLIEHAVELAYKHKDILKAIISKIIPESTQADSGNMRRIILLCPDGTGKQTEVIAYNTKPIVSVPVIDCEVNSHVEEHTKSVNDNVDLPEYEGNTPCENDGGVCHDDVPHFESTPGDIDIDENSKSNPSQEYSPETPDKNSPEVKSETTGDIPNVY